MDSYRQQSPSAGDRHPRRWVGAWVGGLVGGLGGCVGRGFGEGSGWVPWIGMWVGDRGAGTETIRNTTPSPPEWFLH